MILKIKKHLVLTIMVLLSVVSVKAKSEEHNFFKIDTLLYVKYGDSINMLSSNPSLFAAPFAVTNEKIYVLQDDGNVLVFDNKKGFVRRSKIENVKLRDVLDIVLNNDTLILLCLDKIYYINNEFKLVDSVEYAEECIPGIYFIISNKVYLRSDGLKKIIEFDLKSRSFSAKSYNSIWNIESDTCIVSPYPDIYNPEYMFAGASNRFIIAWPTVFSKNKHGIFRLYDVQSCTHQNLIKFDESIILRRNSLDEFKFVNDSTAIFEIKYFDRYKNKGNSAFKLIERDCVFYKITFNEN